MLAHNWRDQHLGQHQLDEKPRDPHGVGTFGKNGRRTSNRSSPRVADSAALGCGVRVAVRAGRSAPMRKQCWCLKAGQSTVELPQAWRDIIPKLQNSVNGACGWSRQRWPND